MGFESKGSGVPPQGLQSQFLCPKPSALKQHLILLRSRVDLKQGRRRARAPCPMLWPEHGYMGYPNDVSDQDMCFLPVRSEVGVHLPISNLADTGFIVGTAVRMMTKSKGASSAQCSIRTFGDVSLYAAEDSCAIVKD